MTDVKSVKKGLFWNSLSLVVHHSVQMTVKFVLAFLLLPEHFGLLGMAVVFVSFASIFADLGISAALIQKDQSQLSKLHWDSAFWFNILISHSTYFIIFLIVAPLAAQYYSEPIIKPIIRAISLNLLWSPLVFLHRTELQKDMEFKKLFFANSIPNIFSGGVAIILALKDFGVWSLVWQSIINSLLVIPIMLIVKKSKIQFRFSYSHLKELFSNGIYDAGIRILGFASNHLNIFILGTLFSPAIVGYFALAKSVTIGVIDPINKVLRKVLFPFFSKIQNDIDRISKYHYAQVYNLLVIFLPVAGILIIYSGFILENIWGEKWINAILPIRILSIYIIVLCLSGTPSMILKSIGKFNLSLRLQIIRFLVFRIPAVLIGGKYSGFNGYLFGMLFSQILILFVDYYFIKVNTSVKMVEIFSKLTAPLISYCCFLMLNFIIYKYFLDTSALILVIALFTSLVIYCIVLVLIRNNVSELRGNLTFSLRLIFEY